jgi:predicted phage-related endonuclease
MTIERIPITDREQWLALRQRDITASDVGIVCGEGAYGSLAELYATKKNLRPPLVDSGVLKRGRWGEAACFEALQDERPEFEIRRAKIYLRDPELRLGCTPDGFAIAPDHDGIGVVQAKVVARSVFRQKWLVDPAADIKTGDVEAPMMYQLQTLTEMMLSEASWGYLIVVINGEFNWDFRMFPIKRHEGAEDRIRRNISDFWQFYLDPGIMPAFNPARDEALIRMLYPQDTGTEIDLTWDNRAAALFDDLIEVKAALKRMKTQSEEIETELKGKLGDNTFGKIEGGRIISWKKQNRRAYTVPASSYRVFRIGKHKATEAE